jgi:hypothetical protein
MRRPKVPDWLVGSGQKSILRAAIAGILPVVIVIGAVNAFARWSPASVKPLRADAGPAVEEPQTPVPPSLFPKFIGELKASTFLPLGLNNLNDLRASGEWLLLVDPVGKRPLLAVDTSEKNKVFDITSTVGSPGVPWERIGVGLKSGQFILRTGLDKSATAIELKKGLTYGAPLVTTSGVSGAGNTTSLWAIGPGRVVATGLLADRLLQFYHFRAGALVAAESVKGPLFPEYPAEKVALSLNRGKIALHPRDHRIVQAFLFSSRVHIYSTEGVIERAIAGPVDAKGIIETKFDKELGFDRHLQGNKGTRYCYLDVTADDHRIYALFSGRTQGGFQGSVPVSGDQLHIFDWDGRFLGAWHLDQDLFGIAVSAGRLFARPREVPGIFEYEVSDLLNVATASNGPSKTQGQPVVSDATRAARRD